MSGALQAVAEDIQSLRDVNTQIENAGQILTNASSVQLPPLASMSELVTQIAATEVSPSRVTATLTAAQQGLETAQQAETVTIRAVYVQ